MAKEAMESCHKAHTKIFLTINLLQKQIDNQQREISSSKDTKQAPSVSKPQAVAKPQAPQQPAAKRTNQFQQRELRPSNSSK